MTGARILVLKQDGLREFVEAEPAFAAIRSANPGVPIDLLTTPAFGRLAKGAPYFDRVLAAGTSLDKQTMKELVGQIKRIGYEQIYDLDGTRTTLELKSAMTGFRGPRWVGPKRVMSTSRRYSSMASSAMRKMLSDSNISVEQRLPDLQWSLSARKDAANMHPSWFGILGEFCLFVPAADPSRRWPSKYFAELAQVLANDGLTCVIIGNDEMAPFAEQVVAQSEKLMKGASGSSVIDLCGKADLAQVAMLARQAHFFVAGASEELHLCVSVGCPGLVMLHPDEQEEAQSLFGRDIIKMTATDMNKLLPDTAVMMLRNMGLIGHRQQMQGVRAAG